MKVKRPPFSGAFFYLPVMNDKLSCPVCDTPKHPDVSDCTFCSYPFDGTEKEQGRFRGEIIVFNDKIEELQKRMGWAQAVLGLLALFGFFVAYGLSAQYNHTQPIIILIGIFPPLIFTACVVFMRKKPLLMSRIAFFSYLIFQLLDAIFDPSTIIQGIIWKVVILTILFAIMSISSDVEKKAKQAPYFYHKLFPNAKRRTILDEIND